MHKPKLYVKPNIRSKPKIPNLLEIDIENLRELYFDLDRGCCILKRDNYNVKLYKDWKIARCLVVKRLSDLIQL